MHIAFQLKKNKNDMYAEDKAKRDSTTMKTCSLMTSSSMNNSHADGQSFHARIAIIKTFWHKIS